MSSGTRALSEDSFRLSFVGEQWSTSWTVRFPDSATSQLFFRGYTVYSMHHVKNILITRITTRAIMDTSHRSWKVYGII